MGVELWEGQTGLSQCISHNALFKSLIGRIRRTTELVTMAPKSTTSSGSPWGERCTAVAAKSAMLNVYPEEAMAFTSCAMITFIPNNLIVSDTPSISLTLIEKEGDEPTFTGSSRLAALTIALSAAPAGAPAAAPAPTFALSSAAALATLGSRRGRASPRAPLCFRLQVVLLLR